MINRLICSMSEKIDVLSLVVPWAFTDKVSKKTVIGMELFLLIALISCSEPESDEAELYAYLDEMKLAVENRSVKQVEPFLSEAFVANNQFDKEKLTRLMRVYFFKYQSVNIFETNLEVMIKPSDPYQATVQGTVLVSGGDGGLLPQRGRLYELDGRWLKVQGEWRLVSLNWK